MRDEKFPDRLVLAANQKTKEQGYWLNQLSGSWGKTVFPRDFNIPANVDIDSSLASRTFSCPPQLNSKLAEVSRSDDRALHAVFTSALALLLHKFTGSSDILLGTPIYKQQKHGDFINTVLVLRIRLKHAMTFKHLLMQTGDVIIKAVENQGYPVEILAQRLDKPIEDGAEFPLFDVALVLENIHFKKYLDNVKPNVLFIFRRHEKTGEVEGRVEYSPSLYKAGTIDTIADCYLNLLANALFGLGTPISAIEFLSVGERQKLLYDFNRTACRFPREKTLHRIFEEQAARTPNQVAIVGPSSHNAVTYSQLNQRANALSRQLQFLGVGPDIVVGLMMNRSIEAAAGILGILKAGGVYLPIDPDFPIERIGYMLEDGRVPVLLTGSRMENHSFSLLQGLHQVKVKPHLTKPRAQITNLDDLPFPDRSLVNYDQYINQIGQAWVKYSVALFTTRGCPYKCAYCHKIWPKKHVTRSAENIFREVELYYRMGIRRFVILDDIFNLHAKNSRKFFELIIENGLDLQLFFPNGMRGDLLSRDYIDLMVKAGTVAMGVALETASPRMQKVIKKNLDLEKLREIVDYICRQYPQVILELYTMHGLPTETREEAMRTMDFIKNTRWLHFPYVNILRIYANTDMEQLMIEQGVSREEIFRSENLYFHELSQTLTFDKAFTLSYQTDFLENYILCKERLLHVLPFQARVLSEDEMIKKYNGYFPGKIDTMDDLLKVLGLSRWELGDLSGVPEERFRVFHLNDRIQGHFPVRQPTPAALRVLLLDLSQFFSSSSNRLDDIYDPPLGLMLVLTALNHRLGNKVNGKIAKSRMDFDSDEELEQLLREFKPDVIGVRSLSYYKDFFHKTIALIRQWGIKVPIIAGGPYASSGYETLLQDRNIDLVVVGEGEATFTELIEMIIDNKGKLPDEQTLQEVAGLAYVPREGRIIQDMARQVIIMDDLCNLPVDSLSQAAVQDDAAPHQSRDSDLAYVIYTSGTTGKPKGVMVEHKNAVNVVTWFARFYEVGSGTHLLQLTDYTFDPSIKDIFGTLLHGAVLHVGHEDLFLDIEEFQRIIERSQIHIVDFVPSMLNHLLGGERRLASLRAVISGGERLSEIVKKRLKDRDYRLYNHYGPTEITIDALVGECTEGPVTLGKPIANVRCYILNQHRQPVPVGVPAELYIGGAGVARGYLNAPLLTAGRFFPDPFTTVSFSEGNVGRMYRSGDMVRWLGEGNIEFLGRLDNQVKIRGYRIEPGEIEDCMLACGEIRQAVVLTGSRNSHFSSGENSHVNDDIHLSAYFIADRSIPIPELKELLARRLPEYMIPLYLIQLDEIPLLPNGKVDLSALPEPTMITRGKGRGDRISLPGDPLEEKLADIWAKVLMLDKEAVLSPNGLESSFFELGGHSLRATQLIAAVHKELGLKMPLEEIFKSSTFRGMADYIKSSYRQQFRAVEAVEKREYYPLSSAQKRLYILQQMDPGSKGYNMPLAAVLEGESDQKRLENTFRKLIKRHESLRTSFDIVNGEPVQKIHQGSNFKIGYYDISRVEAEVKVKEERQKREDREQKTEERKQAADDRPQMKEGEPDHHLSSSDVIPYLSSEFIRPFDLSRAPLLRVSLIKEADQRHILMMDMHHIITDGVSMELLIKDFITLYQDRDLSPLRLQYTDYSHWKNSFRGQINIKKQEAYWLNQFGDEIPVLDLPYDYPRPAVQHFEGDTISFQLGREETRALKELASREGVTLFMLLLAIYNIFLAKLSTQEDIVVGTALAGRNYADLENILGFFLNTLALRNYPRDTKTFRDFLQETKERTLKAFENQDYPFEELVEKLEMPYQNAWNPVYSVMLILQNIGVPQPEEFNENVPGLRVTPYYLKSNSSTNDISLYVQESGDHLFFSLQYCTKLFKTGTGSRFTRYFNKIASTVVKHPGIKLMEIEIITKSEKQQILSRFNHNGRSAAVDKCYLQLFRDQVAGTPLRIASVHKHRHITYGELNAKARQLALLLKERGVTRGRLAAVLCKRSLEMLISILGIFKAGGVYMPFEVDSPPQRLNSILKESRADVLLTVLTAVTDSQWLPGNLCQDTNVNQVIYLDKQGKQDKQLDSSLNKPVSQGIPAPRVSPLPNQPADPSYVFYTSGSTGNPKGVMIHHRGMINHILAKINDLSVTAEDIIAQTASAGFNVSMWQFLASLLTGGSVLIVDKGMVIDPVKFLKVLQERRITVWEAVPSMITAFLQVVEMLEPGKKSELPHLRWMVPTGEALSAPLAVKWYKYYPGIKLLNTYGSTELSDDVIHYVVEQVHAGTRVTVPIGKPIPNIRVYILDRNLSLCPLGVKGDIYVSGLGVGMGYLNQPELTVEKFPQLEAVTGGLLVTAGTGVKGAAGCPGQRIYRTGDIGRWLEDGTIECSGRKDHLVKLRGYRIELQEIEVQLLRHPGIKQAAVIAKETNGKYLCAFLVTAAGTNLEVPRLKEYLSARLPRYMIPAHFIQLEEMPLNSSRKIDRKLLSQLDIDEIAPDRSAPPNVPLNPLEEKLQDIWARVLGIEKDTIGLEANFFELGGHSLKATVMTARIHKELNIEVPLAEVFKTPVIKGISQYIRGLMAAKFVSVEPTEEKEYYPLSSPQKRLYILQQMDLQSTAYNITSITPFPGEPAVEKLEITLKQLIKRHESLRTSFEIIEEQPVQRIHNDVEFEIEYYEIGKRQKVKGNKEELMPNACCLMPESLIKNFIRPFDLCQVPLLRVGLIRYPYTVPHEGPPPSTTPAAHQEECLDSGYMLMIDMHHIISDAPSNEILTTEFMQLYRENKKKLTPLKLQYKDFVQWQYGQEQQESLKRQEEYWLQLLSGELPVLNLPLDYPRPEMKSFEGNSVSFVLDEEDLKNLWNMAKEAEVTIFMCLLAVFNVWLSKLSGQEDIIVGIPIAARRHAELQNIIGMFVNTLALRNYPCGDRTFMDFLKEVKQQLLNAYENQEYPFEDLVDMLTVPRDTSRNPVFDVMFSFLDQSGSPIFSSIQPQRSNESEFIPTTSKFDLNLFAAGSGGELNFSLEYCTRLFRENTIHKIIKYFKKIIHLVTVNRELELSAVEIITDEEKEQLLYEFNDTLVDFPLHRTLHQWFAEQADQEPDRIALIFINENMTYGELNERANRFAQLLRERGVGPDSVVALMLSRSLEMVIGIIAILKAGGAYLPIDPDYPEERITYMLKDSSVTILVTVPGLLEKFEELEQSNSPLERGAFSIVSIGEGRGCLSLQPTANPSHLAYTLYTSGSTGNPKGVMLQHTSLVNLILWGFEFTNLDFSSVLQFATISFDASFHEIFSTLLSRGRLTLIPDELRTDIPGLFGLIKRNDIKTVFLPISFLKIIFNESDHIEMFPGCVRHIQTAGDQVVIGEQFANYLKVNGIYLHNHYGPTETHVVTAYTVNPVSKIFPFPPIGKPVANTVIYILDRYMNPQPRGVVGELFIGGIQLGRGYLNNPELTFEKFINYKLQITNYKQITNYNVQNYKPNGIHAFMQYHSPSPQYPITPLPHSPIYRTGDLAQWQADGNCQFLGRIDQQVKIRGFRVEVGEIQSQLQTCEGIMDAVIVVKEDKSGDKFLCAYAAADKQFKVSELREFLSKKLPDYMIPAFFVLMERIPLTPSGKVDRKALPNHELWSGKGYIPPGNELENKLVEIWAHVLTLEKEKISTDANFFTLGGHSLKATMMMVRIQRELQVRVPLAQVFKTPNIKGLSEYIRGSEEYKYVSIQPAEEKEYYPLSSTQKRLYVLQQVDPGSTAYNLTKIVSLQGTLEKKTLVKTFEKLIERHESLRTSFELIEEPVQRVHRPQQMKFTAMYYPGCKDEKRVIKDFVKPFHLAEAPLLRVSIIDLWEDMHLLLVDMHHIISDGTSDEILVMEFIGLYLGEKLPHLKLRYKDYLEWLNNKRQKKVLEQQEAHWLEIYSGEIPVLNLPADYSRPAVQSFAGNTIRFEMDSEQTGQLKEIAFKESVTTYLLMLAIFYVLLAKLSGQEDIIVGTDVENRRHADLERIIGVFVNTLALRNRPKSEKPFNVFLKELKDITLKDFENQEYPFEDLVDKLGIKRDPGRNPLFDVMFAFQVIALSPTTGGTPGKGMPGLNASPYDFKDNTAKFALLLGVADLGDRLLLDLEYCTKLFSQDTIESFIKQLKEIISTVINNTNIKIKDIVISHDLLTARKNLGPVEFGF